MGNYNKKPARTITCSHCGVPFEAVDARRRFCSSSCVVQASKARRATSSSLDLVIPGEPTYLTPLDVYAGQALNGMLAAGAYPHEATSLAAQAFVLAGAMLRERSAYYQAYPVGGPPAEATEAG